MVKVKMLKLAAGPNGITHPGQVIELTEEAAKIYVDGGYAEYVGRVLRLDLDIHTEATEEQVKTAMVNPPEKAVSQRGKRGKNA